MNEPKPIKLDFQQALDAAKEALERQVLGGFTRQEIVVEGKWPNVRRDKAFNLIIGSVANFQIGPVL